MTNGSQQRPSRAWTSCRPILLIAWLLRPKPEIRVTTGDGSGLDCDWVRRSIAKDCRRERSHAYQVPRNSGLVATHGAIGMDF